MEDRTPYIDIYRASLGQSERFQYKFLIPRYEIVQYFSAVKSKGDLVEVFLNFASQLFENVALFSVYSSRSVQLLKGTGNNIQKNKYLGTYSISKNSIVRKAIINQRPYRGDIPSGEGEKDFFSYFFNDFADEIFLYPANIKEEGTDILYYADGLKCRHVPGIYTFEYLVKKCTLAFQLLWISQRLCSI